MGYLAELAGASNQLAVGSTPTKTIGRRSCRAPRDTVIFVLIGVVAFGVRLVPVLSGTGLYALASYDGSVYYTAAAGLAHGLLPYRDFLLLHPPGIAIALLPFALIGQHVGDEQGLAVARVAWMVLGAFNAVLVARILRPVGLAAMLVGGLFYATFVPALRIERVTSLEAVAATCILGAMLLASRWQRGVPTRAPSALLAGALLGLSAGVKIWGVAIRGRGGGLGSPGRRRPAGLAGRRRGGGRSQRRLPAVLPRRTGGRCGGWWCSTSSGDTAPRTAS